MKIRTILLFFVFLKSVPPTYSHFDEAYNHDGGAVASYPDWMAQVDGTKYLSELSLPGTHDSMSVRGLDIAQNQTMTLVQQLDSGIRVFDMRTRHIHDKFRMQHGIIPEDTCFGNDVLKVIDGFLSEHPDETVLFRLRSEYKPEDNTRSYTDTLNAYLAQFGAKRWLPASQNPTLAEIRGKFVILQEFSGTAPDGSAYGIAYSSLDIQDDYELTTNWDLYDKWTAVKNHLNKAEGGERKMIYMNYLSGAGGSFPYFVVSGHSSHGTSAPRLLTGLSTPLFAGYYPDFPRVGCISIFCSIAFEGTNILTADYIASRPGTPDTRVGMIMTDFPGKRLIENIIRLNGLSTHLHDEL